MKGNMRGFASVRNITLLTFFVVLFVSTAFARKFDQEVRNKALKNTRRVQQSYGSSRQIYWNFGNYFWRLDMRPPALEVGWEFMQSQPILKKGDTFTGTTAATETDMKAYKMRFRLRGQAAVNIKSSFNIDGLLYNEITFDLDQFLSYVFGDIIFVY